MMNKLAYSLDLTRRRIMGGLALAGLSLVTHPLSVFAGENESTNLSRIGLEEWQRLAIQAPEFFVPLPNGEVVTLSRGLRVARRYQDRIYAVFENEPVVYIYHGTSHALLGQISLLGTPDSLKDFAISEHHEVFALFAGQHGIYHLNANGSLLQTIGEFGIERDEQLNGPASLTLDSLGDIHVWDAGAQQIKVFTSNGVYVRAYSIRQPDTQWTKGLLDGDPVGMRRV